MHRMAWAYRRIGWIATIGTLILFLCPVPAHADSPFHDVMRLPPQGGGVGMDHSDAAPAVRSLDLPAIPASYRELPPPIDLIQRVQPGAPAPVPPAQGAAGFSPLAWLGQVFNPGKWLVDSALGSMGAMLASVTGIAEAIGRIGIGQRVDMTGAISVWDQPYAFLFTTPEALTIEPRISGAPAAARSLHQIMQQVAISLLAVIVTYRAVFVLIGGDSYREGLTNLLVSTIGAVAGIQGAWWICELMIRGFNLVTGAVMTTALPGGLSNWDLFSPQRLWGNLATTQGISIVYHVVALIYWVVLAMLVFHAFVRIILVNLMIIVSPLAGLAIATNGAWAYARTWFLRMVELLSTPVIWLITIAFGHSMVNTFGFGADPILGPIFAALTLLMVFRAPQVVGLAVREAGSFVKAVFITRSITSMIKPPALKISTTTMVQPEKAIIGSLQANQATFVMRGPPSAGSGGGSNASASGSGSAGGGGGSGSSSGPRTSGGPSRGSGSAGGGGGGGSSSGPRTSGGGRERRPAVSGSVRRDPRPPHPPTIIDQTG